MRSGANDANRESSALDRNDAPTAQLSYRCLKLARTGMWEITPNKVGSSEATVRFSLVDDKKECPPQHISTTERAVIQHMRAIGRGTTCPLTKLQNPPW